MSHEAAEAASSLRDLDRLSAQSHLTGRSLATGFPMLGWGIAWVVGLPAIDLLHGGLRIVVAVAAWSVGMAMSWWPVRAAIRTGTETRMRGAWLVVLGASPFLVSAARPESLTYVALLLGALWGLAMCLYAVATADWAYAAVAGLGIVVAGAVAVPTLTSPLLIYGVGAGIPMMVLGVVRVVQGTRHA